MSGVTVNLMNKMRLEYSYLALGTSTSLNIRPSIKTGRFYYVEMWVRVHEKNLAVAGQTVVFGLYNTLPSREDPREFSESGAFLSLTMTSGTAAPALLSSGVSTNPGPYLKFMITVNQSSGATGILYTQVSAVLNLREL